MSNSSNDIYNSEHYPDPTAFTAVNRVYQQDQYYLKLKNTIKAVKLICAIAGYELVERLILRDLETGEIHK